MPTVLVIDDDRAVLHMISQTFRDTRVQVSTAGSADEGLAAVSRLNPDVVLLDVMLPGPSWRDTFRRVHEVDAKLPIIFITAGGSSDTAIEAMKLGAYDYLLKPLESYRVQALVRQAIENRRAARVPIGSSEGGAIPDGNYLAGRSLQILEVFKAIGRVSTQNVTVLIRGESGTGKELVARAIYQHSARKGGPYLAVNCAALTESLLESELFGHEKGSFTGADARRLGKFEQCHKGTIFLDEVGDMTPLVQSKVLRVLQEQRFERVGGNQTIEVDVRVLAATNRDLERMVRNNEFRADLYYRLNGFNIELPPLRERGEDIRLLLEHFLARYRHELGKREVESISPEALNLLMQYRWPGNVRELESVVKQALLNATGPIITPESLPDELRLARKPVESSPEDRLPPADLRVLLDERITGEPHDLYAEVLQFMERYLLTRVLRYTDGNQSRAAHLLGITRGSLRNKIRMLGISIDHVINIDDILHAHH